MKKYMTGIQSTGIPHLGNIFGVILPTIKKIKKKKKSLFFIMIADLHSLTNFKNNFFFKKNIYYTASALLSFNIYKRKNIIFFRQSDIKEIYQLFWYLNCFYPYNRLKKSHKIKKKNIFKKKYNTGILNYPILMASDILLYNIEKVIIGKDQIQHIEITRKIAKILNYKFKKKIFNLPKYQLGKKFIIPGINGKKMSKSNSNIINIFEKKRNLEKQIMSIKTLNKSIKDISYKEILKSNLLKIYKLIANKEEFIYIKEKIKNFKIGFENIKKKLFKLIFFLFKKERKKFFYFLNKKKIIKNILFKGYLKSSKIAKKKIYIIKKNLGFKI